MNLQFLKKLKQFLTKEEQSFNYIESSSKNTLFFVDTRVISKILLYLLNAIEGTYIEKDLLFDNYNYNVLCPLELAKANNSSINILKDPKTVIISRHRLGNSYYVSSLENFATSYSYLLDFLEECRISASEKKEALSQEELWLKAYVFLESYQQDSNRQRKV